MSYKFKCEICSEPVTSRHNYLDVECKNCGAYYYYDEALCFVPSKEQMDLLIKDWKEKHEKIETIGEIDFGEEGSGRGII